MTTFTTHVSGRLMTRPGGSGFICPVFATSYDSVVVSLVMRINGEIVSAEWFLSREQLPLMAELLEEAAAAVRAMIDEKTPVTT
jgi:hypothetical protein